jgi:hypothetical protein
MDFFPTTSKLKNGTKQPKCTTVEKLISGRKISMGPANIFNLVFRKTKSQMYPTHTVAIGTGP